MEDRRARSGSPTGRRYGACEKGSGGDTAAARAADRQPLRVALAVTDRYGCGSATTRASTVWKCLEVASSAHRGGAGRSETARAPRFTALTFGNFWRGTTNGRGGPAWQHLDDVHNRRRPGFERLRRGGLLGRYGWQCVAGHQRRPGALPSETESRRPVGCRIPQIVQAGNKPADPADSGGVFFPELQGRAVGAVRLRLDQAPWTDSVDRNISISGLGPGTHRLEVRCRVRDEPRSAPDRRQRNSGWNRGGRDLVGSSAGGHVLLAAITQFVRWRLSAAARKAGGAGGDRSRAHDKLDQGQSFVGRQSRQLRRSEDRLKNAERLAHCRSLGLGCKAKQLSWSEEMFPDFRRAAGVTHPLTTDFSKRSSPQIASGWSNGSISVSRRRMVHSIDFRLPDRTASCEWSTALPRSHWMRKAARRVCLAPVRTLPIPGARSRRTLPERSWRASARLAGGIAHDFNNLLGGVLAQAELALARKASADIPKKN